MYILCVFNGFIKWLMPALEAWWPQNLRLLSKLPTGKLKLFLQDSNAEKSKPVNKQSNTRELLQYFRYLNWLKNIFRIKNLLKAGKN